MRIFFSSLSSLSSIYHEALVSHSNRSPEMTCESILTTWSLWLHVLPNSCPIHLMTRDPEIAFLFDQKRGWKGEYRYFSFKLDSFLYNLRLWERAEMAMCSLMCRKGMKYIENSLPPSISPDTLHIFCLKLSLILRKRYVYYSRNLTKIRFMHWR